MRSHQAAAASSSAAASGWKRASRTNGTKALGDPVAHGSPGLVLDGASLERCRALLGLVEPGLLGLRVGGVIEAFEQFSSETGSFRPGEAQCFPSQVLGGVHRGTLVRARGGMRDLTCSQWSPARDPLWCFAESLSRYVAGAWRVLPMRPDDCHHQPGRSLSVGFSAEPVDPVALQQRPFESGFQSAIEERRLVAMRGMLLVLLTVVACNDDPGDGGGGTGAGGAAGQGGEAACMGGACAGGVGSGGEGGGPSETAVYAAHNPAPGLGVPSLYVTKAVPGRDVCITISVAGVGGGSVAISGNAPWTVGFVVIAQDASQCEGDAWVGPALPGTPGTVTATAATGTLLVEVANGACELDLHALIEFPPDAAWVPSDESFDVDNLTVSGGCD